MMAHLQDILIDAGNVIDYVLEIHRKKEENLLQAYFAARTIQKYFRGHLVRKHLQMLHDRSTIIQKHWRGYLGRQLYYKLLKETVQKRCTEKFNKCATKIQKVWRGYRARKFIFDYYLFKQWMENVKKANKNIMEEIEKERELIEESRKLDAEKDASKTLQCILSKSHHLIRTYHRKGVFSKKEDTREYSFTEELMRSFNAMSYMKKQRQDRAKEENLKLNEDAKANNDVELTLEKIMKLRRDDAFAKEKERNEKVAKEKERNEKVAKEKERAKQETQKKKEKVTERKKPHISKKKRTDDCKCCIMPNYRQY